MTDDLFGPFQHGPYGTNEGDIWSAENSPVGKMIKEKHGGVLIHEVMRKDGKVEEGIYWVEESNPDMEMQGLIKRAREGLKKWVAARAKDN